MAEYRDPSKPGPSHCQRANPMFAAAERGDVDVIKMLLDNGYSFDVFNERGESPLHVATKHNRQPVIKLLLARGANPFSKDIRGYTPWHTAVVNKDPTLMRLFLDWRDATTKKEDPFPRCRRSNDRRNRIRILHHRNCSAEQGECSTSSAPRAEDETDSLEDDAEAVARLHGSINADELLRKPDSKFKCADIDEGFSHHFFSMISNESIRQMKRGKLDKDWNDNGVSSLHLAARFANEDVVRRFMKKKVNLNVPSYGNKAIILMAAAGGSVRVIKMLVKGGAKIDAADVNGLTALHVAAYFGHLSAVRYFLSTPKLSHADKCINGNTPLHYAVLRRRYEPAEAIVEAGADIHALNGREVSPIMVAQFLRDRTIGSQSSSTSSVGGSPPADVDMAEQEPVPGCSKEVKEEDFMIELKTKMDQLSIFKPDPTACSSSRGISGPSTPADSSSRSSNGEPKRKKTKRGGKKHKNKTKVKELTPEQVVAERRERLEELSKSVGAKYDDQFRKNFVDNTVNEHPNSNFNLFIRHFATPSNDTDLDRFIQRGAYDNVEAGAVDVTGRDDIGMTLLHRAIRNGRYHLVVRLVDLGFDVNARTDYELTPLMLAAIGGHHQIVKLLIKAGADIHSVIRNGMNALHYASLYKRLEVVKLLVEAGLDPDQTDAKGETALHKAAMSYDNLAVVSYLVGVGADLHARNFFDYKPLNLAILAKHDETIEYLTAVTLVEEEYHSS